MPSSTAMVWNSRGTPPAARTRLGDEVAEVLEVHVPGHELGVGVGDGHDRLAEVVVAHAGGPPEGAGSGGVAAVGGDAGTQGRHLAHSPAGSGSRPPLAAASWGRSRTCTAGSGSSAPSVSTALTRARSPRRSELISDHGTRRPPRIRRTVTAVGVDDRAHPQRPHDDRQRDQVDQPEQRRAERERGGADGERQRGEHGQRGDAERDLRGGGSVGRS